MAEGGTRSLTGEEEAELRAAVAELPAELRLDPARLGAALADVVPFQVDAATIRQLGLADLVVVDGGAARGGPADGSAEATPDRPPRVPMPARVQPRPADVPRHPGRRQLPPSPPVEEADDLDEPPRRASRLRSTSRVLLGASCIALLAVAWFGINHLRDDDGGPTVALPRLVNLSQQSATEQIEALGASAPKIEIVEERTDEGRPGRVLSQDPDAGEPVGSDDTVTLVVAIGADAPVPKVAGSTQAEAIDALAEAQFGTRVTTEPSTKVAEGDVIRTDPKAGTATPTGSVVEVVVSSGAPATEVPAVTGRAFADAVAALERDEFDVDIVLEDSDQPAGTVLRTSDAAGVDGVILIGQTCDPFSVEAVRATMGSLFAMPIATADFAEFNAWRKQAGARMIAASMRGTHAHDKADYSQRSIVLMGNEQSGLPVDVENECDELVRIPMMGKADSLNLASAASVMIYEVWRGQSYAGARK